MLERDTLQETQIAGSQVVTTSAKQQLQRQLTDREGTQAPCCGSRNRWSFPKQVVLAVAGHIEHKNLCYKSTAMSICMLYIDTCTSCHMTEIQYDPTASKKQLHEMLAPCWNVERDTLQETQIAGSQVVTTSAKQQLQRQLTDREGTQAPCCGSRNKWSFPKQVVLAVAGHIEHKNLCYKSTAMSICMLYIDTCTSCHMTEIQYDPTASKKQLHEMLAPCWNVTHCKKHKSPAVKL